MSVIRQENGSTVLYVNEEKLGSWVPFEIPKEIMGKICQMIDFAYAEGKNTRSKEIKKLINVDENEK